MGTVQHNKIIGPMWAPSRLCAAVGVFLSNMGSVTPKTTVCAYHALHLVDVLVQAHLAQRILQPREVVHVGGPIFTRLTDQV